MTLNISNTVNSYIQKHSKTKLADKLGLTRPTLNNRLKNGLWTTGEIKIIISINNL